MARTTDSGTMERRMRARCSSCAGITGSFGIGSGATIHTTSSRGISAPRAPTCALAARYQCAAGVDVSLKGPADATLGEGEDGSPRMLLSAHASVAGQLGVEQG